jgi:hypothetical protein
MFALAFTSKKLAAQFLSGGRIRKAFNRVGKTNKQINNFMANYSVQNQWGGSSAPWHDGGVFILGCRGTQLVVGLQIQSSDGGKTFHGQMTYAGEGPIGFQAIQNSGNLYTVQNQWGGNNAPWHPGGEWIIGARDNQNVVAVNITSPDGGKSFNGSMTYAGEGPIGFKAEISGDYHYAAQNQWGGNSAPWHDAGVWILCGRSNQNTVAIDITSADNGKTLNGTMTYAGEGPIGFKGTLTTWNTYTVENQWGGNEAPWHPGGSFIIGNRVNQNVVLLKVSSADGGKTLTGENTYAGEGPVGFKAAIAG